MKKEQEISLEALAKEPSPEAWRILCESLAAMPLKTALAEIERLNPLLAKWDDTLRATMCGMSWDDQFFAGKPDPRSSIVRFLRHDRLFFGRYGGMRFRSPNLDAGHMNALGSAAGVATLTRIDFSYHALGASGVSALSESHNFVGLKALKLSSCGIDQAAIEALAHAPFYRQLEELHLGSNALEGDVIAPLVAGGDDLSLSHLQLGSNPLGVAGARVLARAKVPSLRELDLYDCGLESDGAAALARYAGPLDRLQLSMNRLGDDGVRALASGALSARSLVITGDSIGLGGLTALLRAKWPLRSLDLSNNAIDDDAVRTLVELGPETLEELKIDDNDVTGLGLSSLLASDRLGLKSLNVTGNRVGAEAMRHLGRTIRTVETLMLGENRVGDEGVGYLAGAQANALRSLSLIRNGVTARALEALTGAPWFGSLTSLDLSFNPELGSAAGLVLGARPLVSLTLTGCALGDEGAIALATAEFRPKALHLNECDISDRGLEALAHSEVLSNVEKLYLARNRVTDRGILALVRSRHATRVKEIYLDGNRIGDDGAIALAEREGLLAISIDNNNVAERGRAALDALPARCCP